METSKNNKPVLFEWKEGLRYFEKKPPQYLKSIFVVTLLFSVLVYFIAEPLLMFLVWVVFFVAYTTSVIPPPEVTYKINNFGIEIAGFFYHFSAVYYFTILKKTNNQVLKIINNTPGISELRLVLPNNKQEAEAIIEYLKSTLPFVENPPKTEIDRMALWLRKLTGFN